MIQKILLAYDGSDGVGGSRGLRAAPFLAVFRKKVMHYADQAVLAVK